MNKCLIKIKKIVILCEKVEKGFRRKLWFLKECKIEEIRLEC